MFLMKSEDAENSEYVSRLCHAISYTAGKQDSEVIVSSLAAWDNASLALYYPDLQQYVGGEAEDYS